MKELVEVSPKMSIKLIALIGKSASGKDSIFKKALSAGTMNGIIHCTTRPQRMYEKNGTDYYFLSNKDFLKELEKGNILVANTFNNWHYGIKRDAFSQDKVNIGVFSIKDLKALKEKMPNLNIFIVEIVADSRLRLMRSLQRSGALNEEEMAEICRRYFADETDFKEENLKSLGQIKTIRNEAANDVDYAAGFLEGYAANWT